MCLQSPHSLPQTLMLLMLGEKEMPFLVASDIPGASQAGLTWITSKEGTDTKFQGLVKPWCSSTNP